jgi:Na+/H+ antiporter NhaD/arsenite permease-like protein
MAKLALHVATTLNIKASTRVLPCRVPAWLGVFHRAALSDRRVGGHVQAAPLGWAVLLGATLGGNATIIGSDAAMHAMELARWAELAGAQAGVHVHCTSRAGRLVRNSVTITSARFSRTGVVVAFINLVVATAWLLLRFAT